MLVSYNRNVVLTVLLNTVTILYLYTKGFKTTINKKKHSQEAFFRGFSFGKCKKKEFGQNK